MTQKTSACSIQRNQQRAEGSSENLKGVSAVGQSSSLTSQLSWLSHATRTQTSLLQNHCISVSVYLFSGQERCCMNSDFQTKHCLHWIQIDFPSLKCIFKTWILSLVSSLFRRRFAAHPMHSPLSPCFIFSFIVWRPQKHCNALT